MAEELKGLLKLYKSPTILYRVNYYISATPKDVGITTTPFEQRGSIKIGKVLFKYNLIFDGESVCY